MAKKINEQRREYYRLHKQKQRATAKGFNLALARRLYSELIARGVCQCDARWAVLDAVGRGCFGYIQK
ncbi:MAG: hypothetical protein ACLRFN_01095 [Alphaproteobacteria bacterium]